MLALPQVYTFGEAGLKNFDLRYWFGVLAPAHTPKAIITNLAAEIGKVLAVQDVKENLAAQGLDTFYASPEQFAAILKADTVKFARVIKVANIKID